MTFGKPDAGKPPVRFDEGRSETVIGLVPLNPSAPPTLLNLNSEMETADGSWTGILPVVSRAGPEKNFRVAAASTRQARCLSHYRGQSQLRNSGVRR